MPEPLEKSQHLKLLENRLKVLLRDYGFRWDGAKTYFIRSSPYQEQQEILTGRGTHLSSVAERLIGSVPNGEKDEYWNRLQKIFKLSESPDERAVDVPKSKPGRKRGGRPPVGNRASDAGV